MPAAFAAVGTRASGPVHPRGRRRTRGLYGIMLAEVYEYTLAHLAVYPALALYQLIVAIDLAILARELLRSYVGHLPLLSPLGTTQYTHATSRPA